MAGIQAGGMVPVTGSQMKEVHDMIVMINKEQIPVDLEPGSYCCRLDKSSSLTEFRVRFVVPPRVHVPGDCLVQITKGG